MQGVGPVMLHALGRLGLASTVKLDGLKLSRKKAKVSKEKTSTKEKVVCEQVVHAVSPTKDFKGEVVVVDKDLGGSVEASPPIVVGSLCVGVVGARVLVAADDEDAVLNLPHLYDDGLEFSFNDEMTGSKVEEKAHVSVSMEEEVDIDGGETGSKASSPSVDLCIGDNEQSSSTPGSGHSSSSSGSSSISYGEILIRRMLRRWNEDC